MTHAAGIAPPVTGFTDLPDTPPAVRCMSHSERRVFYSLKGMSRENADTKLDADAGCYP